MGGVDDRVRIGIACRSADEAAAVVEALAEVSGRAELGIARPEGEDRPSWEGVIGEAGRSIGGVPHLALGLDGLPSAAEIPSLSVRERGLLVRLAQEFVERIRASRDPAGGAGPSRRYLVLAERMANLERLAGAMFHDIHGPLQTIQVALENIRDANGGRDPDVARNAGVAADEVERAGGLLENLFEFVRIGSGESEGEDVNRLLRGILSLVAKELSRAGIAVRSDLGRIPACRVDRRGMHLVLVCLILNARDAMAGGGTLSVRTALCGDGGIEIRIADTGCGMAPEGVARALEPFFTTKAAGAGTGLGLWLAHSIVEAHRGRLDIESAPEKGTSVRISLPVEGEGSGERGGHVAP
ncbi:MAG: hypothetical protein JXP34_23930 [Planctomycetes bacterium]|nr:hypothetical protein [Planctomycetota bacterium]